MKLQPLALLWLLFPPVYRSESDPAICSRPAKPPSNDNLQRRLLCDAKVDRRVQKHLLMCVEPLFSTPDSCFHTTICQE